MSDLDVVGELQRIIPGKPHTVGDLEPNPQSAPSVILTRVLQVEGKKDTTTPTRKYTNLSIFGWTINLRISPIVETVSLLYWM